jgi:hypothetical protein
MLPFPQIAVFKIVFGVPVETAFYEALYPELPETRMVPITSRYFLESRGIMADAIECFFGESLQEEGYAYEGQEQYEASTQDRC